MQFIFLEMGPFGNAPNAKQISGTGAKAKTGKGIITARIAGRRNDMGIGWIQS